MLHVKELPDLSILRKFAERYPDAEVERVLLFLTFLRVASDLSLGLDGFLDTHELLQGRWWVLLLLMRETSLTATPSSLAKKAGVARATMTGLISGLQRDKLVKRVADSSDGRQTLIKLTTAGQKKLDQIMPDYYRRLNELMSVLSPEESVQLMTIMKKLSQQHHVFNTTLIDNE